MSALLACDLDGTLIFSRRRCEVADPDRDLVCVEHLDGRPLSFMTPAAHDDLQLLGRSVVAVTARSVAQYRRVTLPLPNRYAVVANGGLILVDGEPDRSWSARLSGLLGQVAPVDEVQRHLQFACEDSWTKRIMVVEALF